MHHTLGRWSAPGRVDETGLPGRCQLEILSTCSCKIAESLRYDNQVVSCTGPDRVHQKVGTITNSSASARYIGNQQAVTLPRRVVRSLTVFIEIIVTSGIL